MVFSNIVVLEFALLSFICIVMCVLGCVESSNKGLRHCSSEYKNMYASMHLSYCVVVFETMLLSICLSTLYLCGFFLK